MEDELRHIRAKGFAVLRPMTVYERSRMIGFLGAQAVYVDAHVPQTARNRGDDVRWPRLSETAVRSECICVRTDDAIVAPGLLERGVEHTPLASAYLDKDPAVSYSANAFWTRPGKGPARPDIQDFHVDADDVRFLAMFVYLTDVREPADGPHDIKGPDGVTRTIYGDAGTVFVADTSLSHRGRKPMRGERGIAWWRWGVSDRPPANVWDCVEPVSPTLLGPRYPEDPKVRESIRLLVLPR